MSRWQHQYQPGILFHYEWHDFAYYDTYQYMGAMPGKQHYRAISKLREGNIGNGMICWKLNMKTSYLGCNGYGHDWKFIQKLIAQAKDIRKLDTYRPEYYVCHEPGKFDN